MIGSQADLDALLARYGREATWKRCGGRVLDWQALARDCGGLHVTRRGLFDQRGYGWDGADPL